MRIARGEESSCETPRIDVNTTVAGSLVDVAAIEFAIDDLTGDEPIQIYPDAGFEAVSIAACPGGGRISLGRYVAAWTAPADASLGTHLVRWRARLDDGAPWVEWEEERE